MKNKTVEEMVKDGTAVIIDTTNSQPPENAAIAALRIVKLLDIKKERETLKKIEYIVEQVIQSKVHAEKKKLEKVIEDAKKYHLIRKLINE